MVDKREVIPGQRWKHYKGGIYVVLAIAKLERDLSPQIVYRRVDDVTTNWVRPCREFLGFVDENGYVPRFALVENLPPMDQTSHVITSGYDPEKCTAGLYVTCPSVEEARGLAEHWLESMRDRGVIVIHGSNVTDYSRVTKQ